MCNFGYLNSCMSRFWHIKYDQVVEVNLACLVTKVLLQSVRVEFEFD